MRPIAVLIIVAMTAHSARAQEFQIQLESADFVQSSGPMIFTLASPFEGLPIETEYAIQTPSIQNSLELTAEQLQRIRKEIQVVNKEFQPRYERAAASTDDNEEKQKLTEKLRGEHRKAIEAVVDEILLPHQAFRLKQLQNRGRLQASFNSSEYNEFDELLDLTAEQKKQLAEKSAEMRDKLKAEIQALKQKRSQEVLESVLTDEQRAKLKDVLGDPVSTAEKQ